MHKTDFSYALDAIKNGLKVARRGWNGKGMYVFLIGTDNSRPEGSWFYTNGRDDNMTRLPFIAMKTAQSEIVPWLASQTDILAVDWEIVE